MDDRALVNNLTRRIKNNITNVEDYIFIGNRVKASFDLYFIARLKLPTF